MRQGIVIFAAAAPAAGTAAADVLCAAVAATLTVEGTSAYLAYGDSAASQHLRKLLGGPPPRFFPQAGRPSLGERMAQAFAFLFVQDFERVLLLQPGSVAPSSAQLASLLSALDEVPVRIATPDGAIMIALRRSDFPQIAPIFEDVRWEQAGAQEAAELVLAELSKG